MHYYSADSHIVEPRSLFDGLDARLGSRAPRILRDYKGRRGDWLVARGSFPLQVGRFGSAGQDLRDPETQERIALGYAGLAPGIVDPHLRLADQARDGILGEVLYPTLCMRAFSFKDREAIHHVFRRYNDYCTDYCSVAPQRLVALGCLPLPDVEESLRELRRSSERGVRGFVIPCAAPIDKPYSHPDYDGFWAEAEARGAPLALHTFTGVTWDMGLPAHWDAPAGLVAHTLAHTAVCQAIADLVCRGVVERFPGLRFVVAEFETGWVAQFLRRLDGAIDRKPFGGVDYLTLRPSEYFRRNFRVTFEDDRAGILTRDLIGVDCMMWANDYPHRDSIWPNSMKVLEQVLAGVTEAEQRKLVWSNVLRLYGIDERSVLAAA